MSGYSGLDFSSVGAELSYWLTHVAQTFKGGHPGSGENGYDFSMPRGTPVYAILPGKVVGSGYYNGGGVVSVQYNPQNIIYYQHLDLDQVNVGDQIAVGQQIGLSGGQTSGGNHPATCCSSFEHIEVGINAPFGGIWNPNNVTPNADPIGLFNSLNSQYQANNVATGGSGAATGGNFVGLVAGASQGSGSCGDGSVAISLGPFNFCLPLITERLFTQLIRPLKMAAAGILLAIATLLVVVPATAGPALEVAGVASGKPSLAKIGAGFRQTRKQNQQARRYGMPRPVNPSSVSGTLAEGVQRSRETRRLGEQEASHAAAYRAATTPQPQPQPAQPPTGMTTNPATGKRTMRVQLVNPGTGGPGAGRLVPSVGPNVPSKPPRAKKKAQVNALTYRLGARDYYTHRPISDQDVIRQTRDSDKVLKERLAVAKAATRAQTVRAGRQKQQELAQAKVRRALREKAPATRASRRQPLPPNPAREAGWADIRKALEGLGGGES
jgi:Peptidase family M23